MITLKLSAIHKGTSYSTHLQQLKTFLTTATSTSTYSAYPNIQANMLLCFACITHILLNIIASQRKIWNALQPSEIQERQRKAPVLANCRTEHYHIEHTIKQELFTTHSMTQQNSYKHIIVQRWRQWCLQHRNNACQTLPPSLCKARFWE
jgi:hypothetical protein